MLPAGPRNRLLSLLVVFCLAACATNPVTGKKEFSLLSESDEIELGTSSDAQIVAQYGLVSNPGLAAYVQEIGERMVPVSHRPNLDFHFRVLDDPVVNAFALPGGYVYITRGILAYLQDEAALAGVIGHEIGHVTARHGAQRYTEQALFGVGAGVGAILLRDVPGAGQALGAATQLLLLKYSRDDERQSDQLGVEYATKIGYDTTTMAEFFNTLGTLSGGGSGLPSWASTHPDPGERYQTVLQLTSQWQSQTASPPYSSDQSQYVHAIDGIIFGQNPRHGFVNGGSFVHPDLAFHFPIPASWGLRNTAAQVYLGSEDGKAAIVFALDSRYTSAARAADAFKSEQKPVVVDQSRIRINGFDSVRLISRLGEGADQLQLHSTWINRDDRVYVFHGFTRTADWEGYRTEFALVSNGYARLTDPALLGIQPIRLLIVEVGQGTTFAEIVRNYPIPEAAGVDLADLALMNGLTSHTKVAPGQLLRVLVQAAPSS